MMNFFVIGRARAASRRAKKSQSAADWRAAADAWRKVAPMVPRSSRVWVQYGHALRRSGRPAEACEAYRHVLALRPGMAEAWTGLGVALKAQGQRSAAIDAFVEALRLDPAAAAARDELIRYGGRDHLPRFAQGGATMADALEGIRLSLNQSSIWHDQFQQAAIFPTRDYGTYRKHSPIRPPDVQASTIGTILIEVEAIGASPAHLGATLRSIMAQFYDDWRVEVIASPELRDHPVGSLAYIESRIAFVEADRPAVKGWTLHLVAGAFLDPQALTWFAWTAAATDCALAYSDHDHVTRHWRNGVSYSLPLLQPIYDPYWFSDPQLCPAAFLTREGRPAGISRHSWFLDAACAGGVAHVPHLLASFPRASAEQLAPRPAASPSAAVGRVAVIIPTRDNPSLLAPCVETLLRLADRPDQIDLVIMSNRPHDAQTHRLLKQLAMRSMTRIVNFDEPFNWSRANNVGARHSDAQILLFLNDDTEMLSPRWDSILSDRFAQDDAVGAIGARLLYPAGGVQHAGIIFGMNNDGPQHEARWQGAEEAGPLGRWVRARATSGVTGAFMAMPRTVFEALGGFDEQNFAIAFNDVDMCLRIREGGKIILYDPAIELIHHESISRGSNLTPDMQEWDYGELELLHARWGHVLLRDPGYNPHFARVGYPFDGYRDPGTAEIVDYIRRSAVARPWSVTRIGNG